MSTLTSPTVRRRAAFALAAALPAIVIVVFMQARWEPGSLSSFTVTLAGRTHKCGSVREAIRTLD